MAILLLFLVLLQSQSHDEGVTMRGDHAMGFSHDTTTHHFRLYPSGGAIEVLANDPADTKSRDEIRMHLSHITKMFQDGDFNVPMFIHDTTPPGAPTMSKLHTQINCVLENTPQGAKINITSKNKDAIDAIHEFLRFQITDHKTGDSLNVQPSSPKIENRD
jgi:TusA-related sulfurtransferase